MREIKFRAWNRIVERWQHFDLKYLNDFKESVQWQNLEIMQFTGLLDKNGKEIYEGDIVKYFVAEPDETEIEYIEAVEFSDAQFHVEVAPLYALLDWKVEIIGNIYENPELLKQSEMNNCNHSWWEPYKGSMTLCRNCGVAYPGVSTEEIRRSLLQSK